MKELRRQWRLLAVIGLAALLAGWVSPPLQAGSASGPEIAPGLEKSWKKTSEYSSQAPGWPETPSSQAMLLRLGLGTALVLGLCVGVLWLGRSWLTRLPSKEDGGGRPLHVSDTITLGRRCQIYLVKVGRHQVLAGVDGTGLKSLLALPEPFESTLNAAENESGIRDQGVRNQESGVKNQESGVRN